MARPAARRKIKNPRLKVTRRLANKRAKRAPSAGNAVIAGAWDKTKTTRENYEALGLALHVNSSTARSKVTQDTSALIATERGTVVPITDLSATLQSGAVVQLGTLKHDDEGNVVGVETQELNPLEEDFDAMLEQARASAPKSAVVQKIEHMAAVAASIPAVEKPMHGAEKKWLRRLIAKHGDNEMKMACDIKLNKWQHTPRHIRKRLDMYHMEMVGGEAQ
ncbi:Nucleolar protein 16 [Sorochytrium milnesiophthora]